jgi:hypothetical protein
MNFWMQIKAKERIKYGIYAQHNSQIENKPLLNILERLVERILDGLRTSL